MMKGGSHRKRDSGSSSGSSSKRSSAYGKDSPSLTSFHESSETTKQFNDRFDHLLIESIGSSVVVTVTSGVKYEGILVAANFSSTDGFDIVLKYPKRVQTTSGSANDPVNASIAGPEATLADDLGETFMIHAEDFAELELKDIDFSLDEKWESSKKQEQKEAKDSTDSGRTVGEFKTDTDISRANNKIFERELQKWVPPEGESLDVNSMAGQTLEEASSTWDQFATNEKKFGVKSTYDEHYYTTKINKDAPDFSERLKRAQELAEEIESQGSSGNIHIAEDRGHVIDDSGMDEEDLYSGVDRRGNELLASLKTNAKPSATNKANKYVPPTLRSQPHHMDPAIISSTTAKNIVPTKNIPSTGVSKTLKKAEVGFTKHENSTPASPASPKSSEPHISLDKAELKKATAEVNVAKKTVPKAPSEENKEQGDQKESKVTKETKGIEEPKETKEAKESREIKESKEAKHSKEAKQHGLSPKKEEENGPQSKEGSKGPVSEDAKQRIREQVKNQLKQIKKQGGRRDYSATKPKVSSTMNAPKQVQIEELKKFSQKFKVPYDVPKDMKDVLKKPSTVLRADPSLPPKPKFSVSPPRSSGNKPTSVGPNKSENMRLSAGSQGGNQATSPLISDKSNIYPKKRTPGSFFGPRKVQTGSNKKELYAKNFNFFLKAKEAHEEEKEMEPFLIEKPYFATPTWTGTVEKSYRELLPDEQTLFHRAQARLHQRRMNSMNSMSMAALAATSGVGGAGLNPSMGIAMGIGGPGMVGFPIATAGAPGSEVGSPTPMMGGFATGSIGMYMPFQPQPMFYPSMAPMMPIMGDDSRGNPGTQGSSPQGASSPHMPPAYMNMSMAGIPAYANVAGMIPFPGVMGGAMFGGTAYGQGYHNNGSNGGGSHERHNYHGGHHGHHRSESSSGGSGGSLNATGGSSANNTSNSGGNVTSDGKSW